jgi:hypothetical protein
MAKCQPSARLPIVGCDGSRGRQQTLPLSESGGRIARVGSARTVEIRPSAAGWCVGLRRRDRTAVQPASDRHR